MSNPSRVKLSYVLSILLLMYAFLALLSRHMFSIPSATRPRRSAMAICVYDWLSYTVLPQLALVLVLLHERFVLDT